MLVSFDVRGCPQCLRKRYVVARPTDGGLKYWGAYDDPDRAMTAAKENGALVGKNPAWTEDGK